MRGWGRGRTCDFVVECNWCVILKAIHRDFLGCNWLGCNWLGCNWCVTKAIQRLCCSNCARQNTCFAEVNKKHPFLGYLLGAFPHCCCR
jgi:hypothetical protein